MRRIGRPIGRTAARPGRAAGTTTSERARYLSALSEFSHLQKAALVSLDRQRALRAQNGPYAERIEISLAVRIYAGLLSAMHEAAKNLDIGARNVFLGALRDYSFPPPVRKNLEKVSAELSKTKLAARTSSTASASIPERMRKNVEDIGAAIQAVTEVMTKEARGDVCQKNECFDGGCFRVVNTGGFDARTMTLATRLSEEAARLINEAGFSQVCYGDVYVTQKVKQESTLAFYDLSEDRMYIRAKPKKGEEALEVESIVHELGHRLHFRFVPPEKNRQIQSVFDQWEARFAGSPVDSSTFAPKVGDTFEQGKRRYVVVSDRGTPGDPRRPIVFHRALPDGSPDPKYLNQSMTAERLALALGLGKRTDDPFPSPYARTKPSEMLAELFRAVVMGTATAEQRRVFQEFVG